MTHTPRYLAYARLTGGLDPDATLARDAAAYPGGRMAGYIAWMLERRREWGAANGRPPATDPAAFDAWLAGLQTAEVGA